MFLFVLSKKTDEYDETAKVLLKRIKRNDGDEKKNFNHKNCFVGMNEKDLQNIAFLGHSSTSELEDFTADDFVDKFVQDFKATKFDCKIVKDIYIIGCEVGKKDAKGKSLAQAIAEKLHTKGFTNVVVHAVAEPKRASDVAGMRVGVITKTGNAPYMPEIGTIEGFWLTKAQEDEIKENEKEIERLQKENEDFTKNFQKYKKLSQDNGLKRLKPSQNKREIKKLLLENQQLNHNISQRFFVSTDIIKDLNKPEHCFMHAECLRKQEVLTVKMSAEQQKALDVIDARIAAKNGKKKLSKKDQRTINKLQKLKGNLQKPNDTWQEIVHTASKSFSNKKSPTRMKLQGLLENTKAGPDCVVSPVLSINSESDVVKLTPPPSKRNRVAVRTPKTPAHSIKPPVSAASDENNERTPLMQENKNIKQVQQPAAQPVNKPKDIREISVEKINDYIGELEAGIRERKKERGCFSMFWPGMKGYKSAELTKLVENIKNAGADWKQHVEKARKNRWLVAGFSTHNTRNLLDNILEDQPGKYTNTPEMPALRNRS